MSSWILELVAVLLGVALLMLRESRAGRSKLAVQDLEKGAFSSVSSIDTGDAYNYLNIVI